MYMYNIYHGYISDDAIFAFLCMRSIDILTFSKECRRQFNFIFIDRWPRKARVVKLH